MAENEKQLPAQMQPVFEFLSKDLTWLHVRWINYKTLFRHSDRRIDLLNESAGLFFFVVQHALLADVTMSVCRLADPAGSGKRTNLVIESMLAELDPASDLASTVRKMVSELRATAAPLRDHRNRRIAHQDYRVALMAEENPLPDVSIERIERCLTLCGEILNAIQVHFCESDTGYEHVSAFGGADALVAALIQGEDYEALLREEVIPWEREH